MQSIQSTQITGLILAFILAMIGEGALNSCLAANPSASLAQVNAQLIWVHQYSYTPFYAAERYGYFADQNLEVRLIEGGFKDGGMIDPIEQVVSGKADFGMDRAYHLLQARAEGKPVVAIAAHFQRDPGAIISLKEKLIIRPQDLVGQTVSVPAGSDTWSYNAMLVSQGIDPDTINTIPRTTFEIDPLLNGEVDAMFGWLTHEDVAIREAGYETNLILMGDYGVDTYPNVLFTTEKMIAEQPELIERFLRAIMMGFQDVIKDPDEMATLVLQYDASLDLEEQRRRLQTTLPLLNPAGSRPGMMQPEIWAATHQVLLQEGILSEPIDLEAAYTLAFLEQIYNQ